MKFSTTFSALLCALSLGVSAAPVDSGSDLSLRVNTPAPVTVETPNFKRIKEAHAGLVNGKRYVFTQTNPINAQETDQKTKDLEKALGFSHIYLVVGDVTSSSKTADKGKNKGQVTTTWDFQGKEFDMTLKASDKTKTEQREPRKWESKYATQKTIKYVKETTKTLDAIKAHGAKYVAGHPIYSYDPKGNNCNAYVNDLITFT
ncbi:uncharacterized protein BP5553_08093 [Venustampulla echinocandica]|uniref:Uncharacterized protein n=1 Tax=Venustampulla echinocandica TaxID=2656787 RepID=A0A370TFQ4_9HELO|nr:uncharacterized protein BP5553_08093 [Venustampulla echinocandica]RDL33725.1 hypothetical protein BP5553_08093 [Venustampulla echinocandica]